MKLIVAAAGAMLLSAAFAAPSQAAPVAPGATTLAGEVSQQATDVRWQGRRWNRGHHYGWSRGRHMGARHHRRWR